MPHWQEAIKRLQKVKQDIPKITGSVMVSFALDNIRSESWEGRRWPRRKAGSVRNTGRGLLVDTGRGRGSIRIARSSQNSTELTADDYMQAHNEGVDEPVRVRAHGRSGKPVRSHSRHMKLPQRQFTGKSEKQTEQIERAIANQVVKALT